MRIRTILIALRTYGAAHRRGLAIVTSGLLALTLGGLTISLHLTSAGGWPAVAARVPSPLCPFYTASLPIAAGALLLGLLIHILGSALSYRKGGRAQQ